jgi:hypothetical protein
MVFYVALSNISVITWRPVLLVEETEVSRENHRPVANNWQALHFEITLRINQFDTANRYVNTAAESEDILSFLWELLIYIDTEWLIGLNWCRRCDLKMYKGASNFLYEKSDLSHHGVLRSCLK